MSNVDHDINSKFQFFCKNGDIEQLKKILKEKKFVEDASMNYHYSSGIYYAADYNQLDVVKYLLEESDLKKHASINFENNCILKTACNQNYIEIIHYLILDYKMTITNDLLMPNYTNCNYIMELYKKRNFNISLQKKLP